MGFEPRGEDDSELIKRDQRKRDLPFAGNTTNDKAYGSSADFDLGEGMKARLVGVGDYAVVEGEGPMLASRNYSSCAAVACRGEVNGQVVLVLVHAEATPGGDATQHGASKRVLERLREQYGDEVEWTVMTHRNATFDEEGALRLDQLAPDDRMRIIDTVPERDDSAWRSVYLTDEGVVVERFVDRPKPGETGDLVFYPWFG